MKKSPELSIVVPCHNEQSSLPIFFEAIKNKISDKAKSFEVIFVDDGSSDETLELLKMLKSKSEYLVKIISFSRNFGKEAAMMAGISVSEGEAVTFLDCDLQDPPELLGEMLEKWRSGVDVVLAKRTDRSTDSFLKRFFANAFYKIHNQLSEVPIYENVGDYKLLDRKVVEILKQMPERTRFLKGLTAWVGFKTDYVEYKRPERSAGNTKFTFWKLWNYAIEGITSFSTVPLRVWTYIGSFITLIAFIKGAAIISRTLIYGIDVPGYASLITAIMFFGGVQLLTLGILGEYIGRIFVEAKRRPLYVIQYQDLVENNLKDDSDEK